MRGPQRFAVSSTVSSMRAALASTPIGCARWGWRFEVDQSVSRRAAQSQSCEPPCVEEDVWIDVVTRLAGEALCPVRLGVAHGALVPLERPDPLVERLVGEGRVWTTATPVVLPGYDHRRGRARSQRSVRGLLRHAAVGEALVEAVTREPGARLAGSAHAVRSRRPRHLCAVSVHTPVGTADDAGRGPARARRWRRIP